MKLLRATCPLVATLHASESKLALATVSLSLPATVERKRERERVRSTECVPLSAAPKIGR
jgi:hypothetical protein